MQSIRRLRYTMLTAITQARKRATDGGTLTLDEALELIKDERRRYAIAKICDAGGGDVDFDELVDHVAREQWGDDVTEKRRKAVYVAMYQIHLPKLDDYGVVDYDRDERTIARGVAAPIVEDYLQRVTARPSIVDRVVAAVC